MTPSTATIRIWDPLIRIGHWVLVLAFATAYLTEGEPEWLHSWAGYAIAIVVALRVIWGFVGPQSARFANFVAGPARVLAYLRDLPRGRAERHVGHSPAGGAMTVALLVALATTAVSGMALLASEDGRGPLVGIVARTAVPVEAPLAVGQTVAPAQDDDDDGDDAVAPVANPVVPAVGGVVGDDDEGDEHGEGREGPESVWKEVHEVAANATLLLILLHLAGVILASVMHRENLTRAMVTGRKRV